MIHDLCGSGDLQPSLCWQPQAVPVRFLRLEAGGQSRRPSVALRQVPTLVRALVVRKPCHLALESCDQQGHRSQGHLEHT